jgi:hypothetical protein
MPDRGFPIDGWRSTDHTRIYQGWFRVVMQRLWEHEDGRREWRKDAHNHVLPQTPFTMEMPAASPTRGPRPSDAQ